MSAHHKTSLALVLLLALLGARPADARLSRFMRSARPTTAEQTYCAGVRVPRFMTRLVRRAAGKLGLQRALKQRKLVQVTNATLDRVTRATAKGYLEVVVPADKGHVYFRHGTKVFDFFQGGFRCGGVRPIRSERYGLLVKLTRGQERRLTAYLKGLEASGGKELGAYDFTGRKGFHCVSWLMRLDLDGRGHNLMQVLGSKSDHAPGMPNFSRFVLKKASGVEAVLVYGQRSRTTSQLERMKFRLMSNRGIVKAYLAEKREASPGGN
jgi:hypothetical protein